MAEKGEGSEEERLLQIIDELRKQIEVLKAELAKKDDEIQKLKAECAFKDIQIMWIKAELEHMLKEREYKQNKDFERWLLRAHQEL